MAHPLSIRQKVVPGFTGHRGSRPILVPFLEFVTKAACIEAAPGDERACRGEESCEEQCDASHGYFSRRS